MLRAVRVMTVGLVLGALAAPFPASGRPARADGDAICTVSDSRATELSGLLTTANGYITMNDSQFDAGDMKIFYLDRACKVTRTVSYPTAARDPEDLAQAPDGTVWVGDTGDNVTNETRRETIALWRVPKSGPPVIHRLTYPDGPHDSEALLITKEGEPLIITKEVNAPARLYTTSAPLRPNQATGVALRLVGTFTPRATSVENQFGSLGETMITGAAVAPDRKRVVLRTYTAAYEWDIRDDDIIGSITTTAPRVTVLAGEAQGEAIAYTMDGKSFVTVSDQATAATVRRYTPTAAPPPAPRPSTTATNPPNASSGPNQQTEIPGWSIAATGGAGLLLLVAGIIGLRRSRRAKANQPS